MILSDFTYNLQVQNCTLLFYVRMIFPLKKQSYKARWITDYFFVLTGAFILAAGFVFFITPHKIVPGGVYGIAIVVHYLTVGVFVLAQWHSNRPVWFGIEHTPYLGRN